MRLVYITLGWTAGILLAAREMVQPPAVWLVLAAFLLLLAWLTRNDPPYRLANLALFALTLGGFRYALLPGPGDLAALNNTGGLTLAGVIIDAPDQRDDRTQFRLQVESYTQGGVTTPVNGLALVQAPRLADVRYGDRVTATGELITPAEFDTFSYADFLARQNVFSILPNAEVTRISGGHGVIWRSRLLDLRQQALASINRYLPEPQAGLLAGILLGVEQGIAPEVREAFNATGASHIIAISGFNMALIAGLLMGSGAQPDSERSWLRVGFGLAILALYTLFVGANAAVVRAALMSSLLVIGSKLRRETFVPASLALAALLMSAQDPNVLWDISFQLSFAATLGLALFTTPLQRGLDTLLRRTLPGSGQMLGRLLQEPLVVTLAAQITTLPLIVLYFERVSLVTLLVNLLILPAQPFILIAGGAATLLALMSPLLAGITQAAYGIVYVLLAWTTEIVRGFGALDFADAALRIDPIWIILYFTLLVGWAMMHATQPDIWLQLARFVRRQAVLTAVIVGSLATVLLTGTIAFSRPNGCLHVWFLDMGHSNAVLVQTPGGAQLLVDGGRFPSRLLTALGDRIPFHDREIEVLIVTQPDAFDIAALPAVLERYQIGVALTNGQPNLGEAAIALNDALAGTQVMTVTAGYTLAFDDGVLVEVLHPQQQPTIEDDLSDGVLVLRITYGDVSFLLTSDASVSAQQAMLESGQWPLATVMQLPAHATARSLDHDFLAAVQPSAFAVHIDRANRRGDPDADTLALLPQDLPVYRTDESGTLHFWTDGVRLWRDG
ncbi:ComEC/Rec2 family competence protein [bacterium]|nr:ComEC/Rec2 family competence protein [bacterium]